jgi:hypothetical protein
MQEELSNQASTVAIASEALTGPTLFSVAASQTLGVIEHHAPPH